MSQAAPIMETGSDLLGSMQEARTAADALLGDATYKVRERVTVNGRIDAGLVEREQRATHGLAWFATYAQAVFLEFACRRRHGDGHSPGPSAQ